MPASTRRALLTGAAALTMVSAAHAAAPSDWDRLIATAEAHGDPAITAFLLRTRKAGCTIEQVQDTLRRTAGWHEVRAAYLPHHEDWPEVRARAEYYGFEPEEVEGFYQTLYGPDFGRLSLVVRRAATGEVFRISREGRVS